MARRMVTERSGASRQDSADPGREAAVVAGISTRPRRRVDRRPNRPRRRPAATRSAPPRAPRPRTPGRRAPAHRGPAGRPARSGSAEGAGAVDDPVATFAAVISSGPSTTSGMNADWTGRVSVMLVAVTVVEGVHEERLAQHQGRGGRCHRDALKEVRAEQDPGPREAVAEGGGAGCDDDRRDGLDEGDQPGLGGPAPIERVDDDGEPLRPLGDREREIGRLDTPQGRIAQRRRDDADPGSASDGGQPSRSRRPGRRSNQVSRRRNRLGRPGGSTVHGCSAVTRPVRGLASQGDAHASGGVELLAGPRPPATARPGRDRPTRARSWPAGRARPGAARGTAPRSRPSPAGRSGLPCGAR